MIKTIAMLTYNDQTVDNAMEHYVKNRHAKTSDWGFKDTNIEPLEAKELAELMHADGKEFYFESLVTTPEEGLVSAQIALECKADYIVGMEYFEDVHKLLRGTGVKYIPTCGRRAGYPKRMLYGTIQEIIESAYRILDKGVDGICLSAFRYAEGDPLELAKVFSTSVKAPLVLTGSIDSVERLDFVREVQPAGFTVGSALFEKETFSGGTMAEKLDYIFEYVNS